MNFTIAVDQEDDGRWIADVPALAGVMVYGFTREEAISKVKALALRVLRDSDEIGPKMLSRIAAATGLKPDDLEIEGL